MTENKEARLAVERLTVSLGDRRLVRDVSFTVGAGEILGMVGESGSGKSLSALAVADLLPRGVRQSGGSIYWEGRRIDTLPEKQRRLSVGRQLGIVYQDSQTALNPLMRVGRQVGEVPVLRGEDKSDVRRRVLELFESVGLADPESVWQAWPHELSGGMRQRVLIAMALMPEPRLLIADEPTTALDVETQDQILDLLSRLNQEQDLSILLISHDLNTVARIAQRMVVLYAGHDVETGPTETLLRNPRHEYTRLLLASRVTVAKRGQGLAGIHGQVPGPGEALSGCPFASRCPSAWARCEQMPAMLPVDGEEHVAACHLNQYEVGQ